MCNEINCDQSSYKNGVIDKFVNLRLKLRIKLNYEQDYNFHVCTEEDINFKNKLNEKVSSTKLN